MKERPILFSAPMVRALLAGTKTQTRRIVKVQPGDVHVMRYCAGDLAARQIGACRWEDVRVPYGAPGDCLWVRENVWQAGKWAQTHPEDDSWSKWCGSDRIHFSADGPPPNEANPDYPEGLCGGAYSAAHPCRLWRQFPSIHMRRQWSRIALEITAVRVERLNDITEVDAIAEGVTKGPLTNRWAYRELWEDINGAGSWALNPWVWVIEFRKVEGYIRR